MARMEKMIPASLKEKLKQAAEKEWADYNEHLAIGGKRLHVKSFFKLGAEALGKMLLEDAPEFDEASAEASSVGKHNPYDMKHGFAQMIWRDAFIMGARWQHEQDRLQIAALKAEVERLTLASQASYKLAEVYSEKCDRYRAALENLLCEISEPSWTDERLSYEERQITKGAIEDAREALEEK